MKHHKKLVLTTVCLVVAASVIGLRWVRSRACPDATLVFVCPGGDGSMSPLYFSTSARFGDSDNDFEVSWSYAGGVGAHDLYRFRIMHNGNSSSVWRFVSDSSVLLYAHEHAKLMITPTEKVSLANW